MPALWGITTFFNPSGSRRRVENYRRFREQSARQGLPLVTVELAFGDAEHELQDDADAEIVVKKRSSSVLWQKERLLNLALAALPDECTGVCWADADVLFEDEDWVRDCEQLLERHVVLQPFSAAVRLPRDGRVEDFPGAQVGRAIPEGRADATYSPSLGSMLDRVISRFAGTTGYAWCARRALLDAVGFYDRCIVGGGDREFALAVSYAPGEIPRRKRRIEHEPLLEDMRGWHERVYPRAGRRVGHRPGVIHHLWHGTASDRNYVDRHAILVEHGFRPKRDIALDDQGCWRWADARPELVSAVADYFASRREDG